MKLTRKDFESVGFDHRQSEIFNDLFPGGLSIKPDNFNSACKKMMWHNLDLATLMEVDENFRKFIFNHCEKVDFLDDNHDSVLMYAIQFGDNDTAMKLIGLKKWTNVANEYGNTPLILAVSKGNRFVSKALIDSGCKKDIKNVFGDDAKSYTTKETADLFD